MAGSAAFASEVFKMFKVFEVGGIIVGVEMLRKWMSIVALASGLAGLCASAQANTTAPAPAAFARADAPVRVAQNDITVAPEALSAPSSSSAQPPLYPSAPFGAQTVRFALLLPLQSPTLGRLAAMVRDGFMAAWQHEQDSGITVDVMPTGDAGAEVLSAYQAAQRGHDLVIGPLSRRDVTAVAMSGTVGKPTIALTQAGNSTEADIALPQNMLSIGLSIEQEARQVAGEAAQGKAEGKALTVSAGIAWQRRAARAFAAQWRQAGRGMKSESVEIGLTDGYLNANALAHLIKRLQHDKPDVLFAALGAAQAKQLREAIGTDIPMVGTSQLNPLTMQQWITAERLPELNGTRLVDMPWQLLVDHPAVMAYPHPQSDPAQPRTADMERLYALGIDAYRVAREVAMRRTQFELDGVTGKLSIAFGSGSPRFERVLTPAIYRDGMVVPDDGTGSSESLPGPEGIQGTPGIPGTPGTPGTEGAR